MSDGQTHYLSLWKGLVPAPRPQRPTRREIAAQVAEKYGMTVDDLKSEKRTRAVSWPRQEAMWLMRQEGYAYPAIGRLFGLDHSTCIYGVRAHAARLTLG